MRILFQNKQKGFLLAELAVTAFCLVCICSAVVISVNSLQRYYHKQQVRLAADMLAADIRWLQQETMFSADKVTKTLNVSTSDKLGYSIYNNALHADLYKKVTFADCGYADVYFYQYLGTISFYKNGSPKTNGSYQLRHKKLGAFYCKLSLQPVTGRVTVTEYGG